MAPEDESDLADRVHDVFGLLREELVAVSSRFRSNVLTRVAVRRPAKSPLTAIFRSVLIDSLNALSAVGDRTSPPDEQDDP